MSTSGITSYSCTELEIVTAILSKLGVKESGQALDAEDVQTVRRNLNMIYKQWTAQADFAPGLKMWTRRRAYLFLQKGQTAYSIGPSGDECAAESYVSTTLSAAAGASTLLVTSAAGISGGMRIGVLLSTGYMQWTTASSVVSTTITLAVALTSAAAQGAVVYAYTTKPVRPFEILTAVNRDSAGNDTPMDPNLSLDEYELIPTKTVLGTAARIYFENRKTYSKAYLDASPDDLTRVIRFVFFSQIEDTTAQTDDVDFPSEWFRALVGQGTLDSALDFNKSTTPDMKLFRDEGLRMAQNAYPSTSVAYYQSTPDTY